MIKSFFGSRKLLWQYFCSYLLVLAASMSVLIVCSYHNFSTFHAKVLLENHQRSLSQVKSAMDNELYTLIDMAAQLTQSGDALPFSYEKTPEKGVQLISRIAAYQGTNRFISGMYLYFYGEDYVFSSTSSYRLDTFFRDALVFSPCGAETMRELLTQTKALTILPEQVISGYVMSSSGEGNRMVPVLMPLKYGSGARRGTLLFLISHENAARLFAGISTQTRPAFIVGDDSVIFSNDSAAIPEAELLALLKKNQEQTPSVVGERSYYCLSETGKVLDMRYVLLAPEQELKSAVAGSVRWLMVVSVLVSAVGILLITLLIQSRIKPIRYLYSMLSDLPPEGNELVEIQRHIQKLIDENSAMTAQMQDMAVLKQSGFARNFITGAFKDTISLLAGAETIGLDVDQPCYVVCVLAKPTDSGYELTAEKLWHVFDGVVSGVVRPLGVESRVAMVAFGPDEQTLISWLQSKFEGWRACCVGFTMSVSDIHSHWKEGPRAYLEAEQAFESRFVQGNTQLLRFRALSEQTAQATLPDPKIIDRLRLALRSSDENRIDAVLTDVSAMMHTVTTTIFGFKCMYNEILRIITTEAIRQGIDPKEEIDLFTLSRCLSLDELDGMLRQACAKLIQRRELTGEAAGDDNDDSLTRAREIMAQRYAEMDISVAQIAKEAGIPDSKFAALFKERYGLTPLECLTEHRIDRARELLRNTQMVVKDIALECGYYDISTFNRRFKATTGKTPNQYRSENNPTKEETYE